MCKDKAYEIWLNLKYDGYQRGLACMVYQFFDDDDNDDDDDDDDDDDELFLWYGWPTKDI